MQKLKKTFLLFTTLFITMCTVSCSTNNISYLDIEQNNTINSLRVVPNTNNQAYEINYTADYKIDEFIETVTDNKIVSSGECRKLMKQLLADGSKIEPMKRLSNYEPGCSTVVCKNPDGETVVGRNYDLDIRANCATVVIHTAPSDGYKSVGIADCGQNGLSLIDLKENTDNKELLLYAPYFTMDGINEKGFICSIMLLNEGGSVQNTGKNWLPSTLIVRYLLDYADSVESAVELLSKMDFRNGYLIEPSLADISFHWLIADESGDKAVIEYVDGEMIVNRCPVKVDFNENDASFSIEYPNEEKDYLISTNFFVSENFETKILDSGLWRYETLDEQLSKNSVLTKEELRDLMKSAKYFMNDREYMLYLKEMGLDPSDPEKWDWITVWTDILNTSEKSLILWMKEDYKIENTFEIDYQ